MIVDLYLDLVSLIIGCMVFRKSWVFAYRCLFFLNVFRVVVSFTAYFWTHYTHSSNHWLFNLFLPLQCAGFLWVFYKCSLHPKVARVNKWLLILLPVVGALCWARGGASLEDINIFALVGFDFLVLLSVCMAFVDLLLRTDSVHFVRQPMFWLASGLFFYSIECIIGYSVYEYSKKMILFWMYKLILFSADYLTDMGVVGCFICIYLERSVKKPEPV